MPVILRPESCGDEPFGHRLELHEDGSVVILDHPHLEMMEAFTAFGAKPPGCMNLRNLLEAPEPEYLVSVLAWNEEYKTIAKIGLAWARHVEPLISKYTSESAPAHWLKVARDALRGNAETGSASLTFARESFEAVRDRLRVASRDSRGAPRIQAARDAVHVAQGAVRLVGEELKRQHLVAYRHPDYRAMLLALGRSAYHAMGEDAVASGGSGRDEDDAKHAEVAWQRLAAIKAADGLDLRMAPR
jgi:hypothetical protein